MDLYSRKIISWTLGKTLEAKWILEAVEKNEKGTVCDLPEDIKKNPQSHEWHFHF